MIDCLDCFRSYRPTVSMNRILATFAGVLSSISLFVIYQTADPRWLIAGIVFWLAGLIFLYTTGWGDKERDWHALLLILTTSIGLVGLLSLIEWPPLIYFLILLAGVMIATLFRFETHIDARGLSYMQKPFRRMAMMLWVFDAYAFQTALFALVLFFPGIPFWVIVLIGAALFCYVSYMIWHLYLPAPVRSYGLWLALVGLLMSEIIWSVQLLPFGYAVSGFVVTWLWYLAQLLLRFHFTKQGILWKEQRWFLATNGILMILFFVFVFRWI